MEHVSPWSLHAPSDQKNTEIDKVQICQEQTPLDKDVP